MNTNIKNKKVMKNAILIFVALFTALMSINAQSNFRPGYIITNEMDTIEGLIDFRTYKMNAHNCTFRATDTSEDVVYSPGDIYGYRFTDDGKYYVTKNIEIEGLQRRVFLEYLIQGLISLYFYPDEKSTYYFFQNESGRMIPVTKRSDKYVYKNGQKYAIEDKRYVGILYNVFEESKSVSKATNKISFRQDKMIDLTKKYHDEMCTTGEECIQFETKPDKYIETRISVYAGLRMNTFIFYNNANIKNLNLNSVSAEIGTQANFLIPRWSKSVSIQVDAFYTPFEAAGSEGNRIRIEHIGWIAAGKLGGKYTTYNKELFRPLVEGGVVMNYLHSTFDIYRPHPYRYYGYIIRDFVFGYYVGAGFDCHLRKDKDNALLFRIVYDNCQFSDWGSMTTWTAWQFRLGYTF